MSFYKSTNLSLCSTGPSEPNPLSGGGSRIDPANRNSQPILSGCQGNVNLSGRGQRESFRFCHPLGSLGEIFYEPVSVSLPRVCRRRDVLGRLRPDDRRGQDTLRALSDLPVAQVPAFIADDHPAVEVQHHRGRTAQHPSRRLLDGKASSLPADEVAVEDRTNSLEAEDLFEQPQLLDQSVLECGEGPLDSALGLGRVGMDELDPQLLGRAFELGRGLLAPTGPVLLLVEGVP